MEDWEKFLKEAGEFFRSARGKDGKPSRLANDIQYNLLALSFEKSIMAIHMFNNDLVDNHTFTDLIDSVTKYFPVPAPLRSEVLDLEKTQSICNLYEYSREKPSDAVVTRLAGVAEYFMEQATVICCPAG